MANVVDNSPAEAAEWKAESYDYQAGEVWPRRGQHILAQYDEDSVVVYQAFRPEIADYAVANQNFVGCPDYNPLRMTWIKTNFLWMMFRSRWASRPKQERVLAIFLRRERFDYYLSCARRKGSVQGELGTVRLQWDPDHFPDGSRHPYRRAVQLGLKGVKSFGNGNDILRIVDVTAFVHEQATRALVKKRDGLLVASERVYIPETDEAIAAVGLSKAQDQSVIVKEEDVYGNSTENIEANTIGKDTRRHRRKSDSRNGKGGKKRFSHQF